MTEGFFDDSRRRDNFQFYEKSMNKKAYKRLILENELRKAIDNDEFVAKIKSLLRRFV